jgi:hypothetical protein
MKDGVINQFNGSDGYEDYPATLGEEQLHSDSDNNRIKLSNIVILFSSPALILEKGNQ